MFTGMATVGAGHRYPRSAELYKRARRVFPAGTTRSTIDTDPHPLYLTGGQGAHVTDADGNRLLDLNNNFTTLIHGHGFEPVAGAVAGLLRRGTCFSNPTPHEMALAELLVARIPAIDAVRFVNSGTEAVMFAIKAARAFTGRPAIVRFKGAYHGAYDWAEAGQNGLEGEGEEKRRPKQGCAGAPRSTGDDVVVADFNDADGLEEILFPHRDRLAAILIDPMPSRAGLLSPDPRFIASVNALAARHGIVIIADEVLNLRQAHEGASARYGLNAGLVTAGKIIGGGFPIGAVAGRADIMAVFGSDGRAPLVPQGGTFSANPVSMLAGRIAMEAMTPNAFARLDDMGTRLRARLNGIAVAHGAPFSVAGAASLFRIHAKAVLPKRHMDAIATGEEIARMRRLGRFFQHEGILLPSGAAACLSTPMTEGDLDHIASTFKAFVECDSNTRETRT